MSEPIDIVIAWVDGNDPSHRKKMKPYLREEFGVAANSVLADDLAGETRYRSVGEIFYCVASILRFAPFVRKIFIVTDQQNPNLDEFIKTHFPKNNIPIELVDHSIIFKGYERYLPVFNSLSIETCLFRIPGLSENFVYFNDDFFLVRDVSPQDWFRNNMAVAYGAWSAICWVKLLKWFKPKKNGAKPFGFKDSMINTAQHLPETHRFFKITHTPQPLKKSVFENFFPANEDALIFNISHKFRNPAQFNPQVLFYMIALKNGRATICKENKLLYLKPVNRGNTYVERKIKEFEKNADIKFCCIGSLDLATENNREKVFAWLDAICGVNDQLRKDSSTQSAEN